MPTDLGDGDPRLWLQRRGLDKVVQYDLPPMYGGSRHRNDIDITDDSGSAEIVDESGELKLHLGDNDGDKIVLDSAVDMQYRSGTFADLSVGVRIPEGPVGEQYVLWGPFDDNAGVGYRYDKNGLFTFRRRNGDDTTYGPQSATLPADNQWRLAPTKAVDLSVGHVFHVLSRMYGHGPILPYVELKDPSTGLAPAVPLDRRVYSKQINVEDFNKPIRVEVAANGTAEPLDVYLGGRQYTLWGDKGTFEQRSTTDIIKSYTTSTTDWEPLIAIRKKASFPPGTGRRNTVRAVVEQIAARAGDDAEIRYTQKANVENPDADFLSQGSMQEDAETAIETIIDAGGDNGNEYQAAADTSEISVGADRGGQLAHGFLTGGNFSAEPVQEDAQVPIGHDTTGVLWVRTASTGVTVDAAVRYQQQF